MTIQPTITAADYEPIVLTKVEIIEKIRMYADKYNVSFQEMYDTVECETANTFDPEIQSMVKYSFSDPKRGIVIGEQEESYGLAQWFIPAGNKTKQGITITKEMAQNPDIALDTMAFYFSVEKKYLWSCYKKTLNKKH